MIMFWIFLAAALLAAMGGVLYRRRLRALRRGGRVDDAVIRQIEEHGRAEVEEPLDWETIDEEEGRFWEESWDDPDEW